MVGANRPSCGGDGRGEPHGNRSASRDPETVQAAPCSVLCDAIARKRGAVRRLSRLVPWKARARKGGGAERLPLSMPLPAGWRGAGGTYRPAAHSPEAILPAGGLAGGSEREARIRGKGSGLARKRRAGGRRVPAGRQVVQRLRDTVGGPCGEARQEWLRRASPGGRRRRRRDGRGRMTGATSCPASEREGRCFRTLRRGVRRLRGGADGPPAAARSPVRSRRGTSRSCRARKC
jgi:hypothetical protein